jgi:hypothetical protein
MDSTKYSTPSISFYLTPISNYNNPLMKTDQGNQFEKVEQGHKKTKKPQPHKTRITVIK